MSITIEVRRHTDDDDDVLTPDGVAAALRLGATLAGTPPDLVVTTGAQRTTQAAANVLAGGGLLVPGGVVVEPGLRSGHEDRWRDAYASAGSGHLDAMRDTDPDFVDGEVASLGAALGRVAARLPDGGRVVVIGHSPTNEAAVLGLTGTTIEPLGKGEGVVLVGDGGDWEVTRAHDPTDD